MSTLETLQDILVSDYKLDRGQLAADRSLDALGVDSLGLLELMFKIEDRFQIKIADDTPTNLRTIADVVGYIDSLIAAQPANRAAPAQRAAVKN